ncbi:SpoIIE family protein phosphatase [Streptomyces sp. NPDC003393]
MTTVRSLLRRPSSLLAVYLSAVCAVQLSTSTGGLVRWSDYSVLVPVVAAALLPFARTVAIGAATVLASVAVYGFAIRGVSDGGRTVVIAAAALSFGLSLVICRSRARPQRRTCTAAARPVHHIGATQFDSDVTRALDTASRDTPASSVSHAPLDPLPQPAAVDLAARGSTADGPARPKTHWLDVIPLSSARIALVAGSLAPDGNTAPALTAELRAAVRTLADIDLQPVELLTHLEHVLNRLRPTNGSNPHGTGASQVTARCLYAVYDPVSARCILASAGYPAPTVVRPDGGVTAVAVPTGPPLGQAQPPAEATEVELDEGSVLLLHGHTPGTPDPEAGTDKTVPTGAGFGSPPCLDAICRSDLDALLAAGRYTHADVLAARTHTFSGSNVAFWDLGADFAAVSEAREHVSQTLAEWGLEDTVPTTQLIASELVTNALRHARPPVRLRLILHGTGLTCEVSDGSTTSPHLGRARTFDESGRGLFIVAQLTRRWGTRYDGNGKIIWAEEQLSASQDAHADGHDTALRPKTTSTMNAT